MAKAISAVVSVILLLLITIAIAGLAFTFFIKAFSETGDKAGDQTAWQTQEMEKLTAIENVHNNDIYLRNIGKHDLKENDFSVYIDGFRAEIIFPDTRPNQIGALSIEQEISSNNAVRIVGP
ncbi:MAG: archaellin/type IV pilin N-terminal domain-containing protein, partial [Candidatus Aenigmatarchaeota archaeon]